MQNETVMSLDFYIKTTVPLRKVLHFVVFTVILDEIHEHPVPKELAGFELIAV
ncbi:MAG: hypothetical protein F6K42_07960 [Leptolyngbya sp. SIO1D8]|nr:hypothetical protein [Leptolyngbya sp. SIO1D8]